MKRRNRTENLPPPTPETLVIDRLGAQGDGIARTKLGESVFVPFALPGETVKANTRAGRGRLTEIVTPSPNRIGPRCAHYTICGGCSLQHLADGPYLEFKREAVRSALASRGLDVDVAPVIATPPRTRRRATFSADRRGTKTARVGFHGAKSHDLVQITDCAVMTPGLLALIPKLERVAQIAAPPSGGIVITATETATGFDVSLTGVGKWFSADDRLRLTQDAAALGLARISVDGDVLLELKPPAVRAGPAFLSPPPGGFLQASAAAEAAMVKLVAEAVAGAGSVVDLFSGSGTFTLPLAANARVHAVESEAAALAALAKAAKATPSLKPVSTEARDLFRRPLTEAELDKFDAIVLDPPRAGAEDQASRIAASKVRRVVYVSCSPATLARDLRTLVDGGLAIDSVTPVDQFLWSPHVEVVAVLSRRKSLTSSASA